MNDVDTVERERRNALKRQWYAKNKEKCAGYSKKHRMKEGARELEKARQNKYRQSDKYKETARKYYASRYEEQMLYRAKHRAEAKNLDFDITLSDIQIPKYCPVFQDMKLSKVNTKLADNSPTIDRIDNAKGYTKDNIIVVSWKANNIKGFATIEELAEVVYFYGKLRQQGIKNRIVPGSSGEQV